MWKNEPFTEEDLQIFAIMESWVAGTACTFKRPKPRRVREYVKEYPCWWTDEIQELRVIRIAARRKLTRYRRRKLKDPDEESVLFEDYSTVNQKYKTLINEAKARIRAEDVEHCCC